MGRKPTPQPLMLDTSALDDDQPPAADTASPAVASPADSKSPRSHKPQRPAFPISKFAVHKNNLSRTGRAVALQPTAQQPPEASQPPCNTQPAQKQPAQKQPTQKQPTQNGTESRSASPSVPSVSSAIESLSAAGPPPLQGSRSAVTEGSKPAKSNFFQFNKASKVANHSQNTNTQAHQHSESRSQILSRGNEGAETSRHNRDLSHTDDTPHKPFPSFPSLSDLSISSVGDTDAASTTSSSRKNKGKSFALLNRTRSTRDKDHGAKLTREKDQGTKSAREKDHGTKSTRDKEHGNLKAAPVTLPTAPSNPALHENTTSSRPAPVAQDRTLRDMMTSTVRNRSEDRTIPANKEHHREKDHKDHKSHSHLLRDTGPSTFLSGLRNSSTRAADLISKGLFGKGSRSGSTTEREPVVDDEHYVLKVINLPLVEQTRLTRISKRLEDSRDKTEFWMPAFPWRAIDYLNNKGCEVEGLYRVPGSGPQIKKWQRRFDEQHDVNLFDQSDLYDINIVGSMLKAWLRELPDELFPKEAQERVARECSGAEKVPAMLMDELSNLPPFNYYLLFAITCHLSLLLAHSDKNKMDFRNLCICFQPCMKLDAFCFKFLVCDWRDCWKGCTNEAKYIEEEYRVFDQPPPRGLASVQLPAHVDAKDDRQSSPPCSDEASIHDENEQQERLKKHQPQSSRSNLSIDEASIHDPSEQNGGRNKHRLQLSKSNVSIDEASIHENSEHQGKVNKHRLQLSQSNVSSDEASIHDNSERKEKLNKHRLQLSQSNMSSEASIHDNSEQKGKLNKHRLQLSQSNVSSDEASIHGNGEPKGRLNKHRLQLSQSNLSSDVASIQEDEQKGKLNKHRLQLSQSNVSISSSSSISTDLSAESEQEGITSGFPGLTPAPTTRTRELRPLSPIQPLSPLGF